ncbi:uncharacterized protein LOC111250659 isoform X2 [Varroa destructor]|uniref:Kinesin motor domain-containing protein n=1 Tax=Varroa destructor TaxID=109461 RepID=A0A7M7KJK3_VARDE|nr:uncharacterized protein LOC111250659 isoform X2 [Varroa destructor]
MSGGNSGGVAITGTGGGGTSTSDSISVAVRVRPAKSVSDPVEWIVQDNVIYGAQPENQHNVFAFDHIFSQETTNTNVYEKVVGPIIESVLDGYHGTVFAYGQTSSGKTHTMMGNDADPGIIKRAIAYIFERIHKDADREFMIRISYLEIYNEQIRDLLNPATQSSALQIKGPDMAVSGLVEQVCRDADELMKWMLAGDKNRQVGCTNMNERSSRSHSIFRVTLESSHRDAVGNKREGVTISQLNLVDLAGSERATQTGATGTRLREGCHINTSLTALGIVIRKLSKQEKHINFRDSKLTRILQNSLGGNSRTAIVCTISPFDYETSLSTLRFGSDAKRIRNKPVINQVLSEDASLLQKRNKEIESLKALICKVKTGKEQELKEKDDTISQLQKKIEDLQRLAICGDLPSSITERTYSMPLRVDCRRRETWCPGQIAAATPGKSLLTSTGASTMFEQRHTSGGSNEDSFLAQYGTYDDGLKNDFGAFCTPARPRKRKSLEIDCPASSSSTETLKSLTSQCDVSRKNEEYEDLAALKGKYEDAMSELRELREHIAFLQAEQKLCCQATPGLAAKRPRIKTVDPLAPHESSDPSGTESGGFNQESSSCTNTDQEAVTRTPVNGLSLILEEESELEGESPFERKLKLMATPRQTITSMKRENALLKRSLMAFSGYASPSETTGTTLRNGSGALFLRSPSPGVQTYEVGCQYEEIVSGETNPLENLTATDQSTPVSNEPPRQMVNRSTSPLPLLATPMKSELPIRSTPRRRDTCDSLITFLTPQTREICTASHVQGSMVSWLETEGTPINFPLVLKDMAVQTDCAVEASGSSVEINGKIKEKSCVADASIMTELSPVMTDASTSVTGTLLNDDTKLQTVVVTEVEAKTILVDANTSAIIFPSEGLTKADASTSFGMPTHQEKAEITEMAVFTELEAKLIPVNVNVSPTCFPENAVASFAAAGQPIGHEVITTDVVTQTDFEEKLDTMHAADVKRQHGERVLHATHVEVQCVTEMTDVSTLASVAIMDAASQTDKETKVAPMAPCRATKFLFATRCMDNPAFAGIASPSELLIGMNALLGSAESAKDPVEPSVKSGTKWEQPVPKRRDVGCQARIEELWVIRMKLDKEKAAREDAEKRCDELWREKSRLVKTNDKYLAFLKQSGIDPKKVLSEEVVAKPLKDTRNIATSTPSTAEQYRQKYEAIKEFCWRHPDIKDRLLSERVVLARPKVPQVSQTLNFGKDSPAAGKLNSESETPGDHSNEAQEDRPLANLQDVQEFRGVDYLAKADPGECRPS